MIFLRVITRKDDEQIGHGFTQRDVVILNTEHHCHPELVSGSQKLRRFRNKFGMTINNIPLLEIKDFGPPARGGHFVWQSHLGLGTIKS